MSKAINEDTKWKQVDEISSLYWFDTSDNPDTLIYFVTGSGCTSLRSHMPAYFRDIQGSFRVYGLEKIGVSNGDPGLSCDMEFYGHYDFQTLYSRNQKALEYLLNAYGSKFDKIVLFGVSEGGVIASKLASEIQGIDDVVIIGSGGLPQRQSLGILADNYGQNLSVQNINAMIKKDENSLDMIYGQTVKYWSSFLDIVPATFLARTDANVLVIMGGEDRSEPIESLYYLADELQNRPNITYRVIKNANHALVSGNMDFKPYVMQRISNWIATGSF